VYSKYRDESIIIEVEGKSLYDNFQFLEYSLYFIDSFVPIFSHFFVLQKFTSILKQLINLHKQKGYCSPYTNVWILCPYLCSNRIFLLRNTLVFSLYLFSLCIRFYSKLFEFLLLRYEFYKNYSYNPNFHLSSIQHFTAMIFITSISIWLCVTSVVINECKTRDTNWIENLVFRNESGLSSHFYKNLIN
jgi:hypothetical protein